VTTTISVSARRQVVLPKEFCERKRIAPGTALRVTESSDGLCLTPILPPTEEEFKAVVRASNTGHGRRRKTAADDKLIADTIKRYREEKRRKEA